MYAGSSHPLSRWQPQVRVAYDYYPFGLTWHNPAAADTPEGRHDHAYQDKEFQWNEFGAGVGMALYDFHARMYDPATATWSVPDPAEQFANPYLAMGNNPVVGVDPDGEFVVAAMVVGAVVGAYIGGTVANGSMDPTRWDFSSVDTWAYMAFGAGVGAAVGYGFAHGFGALSISPDFRLGTEQVGFGLNITAGVAFGPVSIGMRFGVSYYSSSWSGTSGLETRTGFTFGVGRDEPLQSFGSGNWLQYNVTHFQSGETSQTIANFRFGREKGLHFRYENDFMFDLPGADGGDRFRTAAQQLGYRKFKLGVTMFTGDPDANDGSGRRPWSIIGGKQTYISENGSDPDKYRAGIGYIGFGNFKVGINSETIRHVVQNRFAHDIMTKGAAKWFRQMHDEYPNRFFFGFGSNPYTLY